MHEGKATRCSDADRRLPSAPRGRGIPRRSSPYRILIVEDNVDGRDSLQTLLQLLGYQVETAADGLEGVTKALAWRPHVALVDIGLPGLDGYEVARRIREALGLGVFLIAYTAYSQPRDREQALEAGFDVHLAKPVNLDELSYWLIVATARKLFHTPVSEGVARLKAEPACAEQEAPSVATLPGSGAISGT